MNSFERVMIRKINSFFFHRLHSLFIAVHLHAFASNSLISCFISTWRTTARRPIVEWIPESLCSRYRGNQFSRLFSLINTVRTETVFIERILTYKILNARIVNRSKILWIQITPIDFYEMTYTYNLIVASPHRRIVFFWHKYMFI